MKTLAIVGCGKLARIVAQAVANKTLDNYTVIAAYSRSKSSAEALANITPCNVCDSIEELLSFKPDYIVEAASPAAMKQLTIPALNAGCNIVTLSIGAFADDEFYAQAMQTAKDNNRNIYIVSGATGGFDVLQTVSLMGGAKAKFFNEKGPNALKGTAVYDEALQNEQRTVFTGTAKEAIAMFPTKVNVTVAASRASVGPENMHVTMQSSPSFVGDTQRVEIENDQVHAVIDVYSRTAEIAGWSVVSTLKNLSSPIVFV